MACLAGGIADAASTGAGPRPASSAGSGVTCFGLPFEWSGAFFVAVLMSFSAPSLPPFTSPWTASLTSAALPESANSSASSRFLGAAFAIAFLTASMKALRSNVPGFCSPISSTCAAAAWLWTSLPGGTAAAWAAAAPVAGGACCFSCVAAPFARPCIAWKRGSCLGSSLGGAASAP